MTATVLVIDDDDATRATLRTLLEDEGGYVVLEACDVEIALAQLHEDSRNLVVLFDYRMPRTDGEALMALAEREHWLVARHAFICMTAVSRDRLPATLLSLLTHYHVPLVTKPFDIETMLAAIREAEVALANLSNGHSQGT